MSIVSGWFAVGWGVGRSDAGSGFVEGGGGVCGFGVVLVGPAVGGGGGFDDVFPVSVLPGVVVCPGAVWQFLDHW